MTAVAAVDTKAGGGFGLDASGVVPVASAMYFGDTKCISGTPYLIPDIGKLRIKYGVPEIDGVPEKDELAEAPSNGSQ